MAADIYISEEMSKAVFEACEKEHCYCDDYEVIVRAVLRFVSEHPIVPTIDEVRDIVDNRLSYDPGTYTAIETIREWIGIMFYIGKRIEIGDDSHGIQ